MAHPLEKKISQVRRQAKRLLLLYALAWTLGSVLAVALALGAADFVIRFQDHGIRLMCSLAVVATLLWSVYRYWFAGLGQSLGDVQIAQRIERRFPALRDRLTSTVQFLRQSETDAQAGSAVLRRALIVETSSAADSLDFSQVFERRPTRRALLGAGMIGMVALLIAVIAPQSAQIGLARLARPFGSDAWPRFYSVAFRETPTRLAVGQTFEVELIDGAGHRVPEQVRLRYRFENGRGDVEEEVEPMHRLNGAMVARRENVTRPFSYRAEGGDDQTDWIRLEVVEPPRLNSLEVTLVPPAYTGLPAESSEKSIHALRDTRVALAGSSTKKLRSATLHQENGEGIVTELSGDAYGFALRADAAAPFVIDKSGAYWIVLEDEEGLEGGADDRWDIRAIPDLAPSVMLEQPSANIFVTPQGEVPVKIAVKDDLAILKVGLHFSRSDRTDVEEFVVGLYQGPDQVAIQPSGAFQTSGRLGEQKIVEHRWALPELGLKPGAQVTFWATASDYLPQVGKSTVRKLTIITPQELEDRLAQRQSLIFGELQRMLKLQQDARAQTKSLEIQMQQVGQLTKPDVDHAQAAELNQRQITRTLTSQNEGIPAQLADFLADLANNRVDSPDLERHMNAISSELERLGQEHLSAVERELTSVIKAAQARLSKNADESKPKPALDPLLGKSLATAGENQDQVIASLESMLSELGQWDSYRRFGRDIAQLGRDQDEVARATKELGQKTLGREQKDLDPQQQADLKKLASLQVELSRRLEKVQQQMAQMNNALKQTDPLSAATIADGLHQTQQQAISGQMRQAGERLNKNQLGQAIQQQAKIAKDLEDLMAILSNRREQELTRLVKQLREAEQDMARVRAQQAGLRKKVREASEKSDPQERKRQLERLGREQKQLQEEAARLARRLERLQAEKASRSTAGAAGKMDQAGNAQQQGDAPAAEEQAQNAEKDLQEAQQQLAERRRQAEEDLAREQIARMEDSLKSLHERQKTMISETKRLDDLRGVEGRLTRGQLGTINDLARQQQALRAEISTLAEKLALSEVINLALEGAAKHMARAADLLRDQRTGSLTQASEEAARLRLAQLLTAFENKTKPQAQSQKEDGSGGGGSGKSRSDGNQVLTQLKLLKILQEDLNDRFHSLTAQEEANSTAEVELSEVAAEQGKLADLALKLAEPPEGNPEDDPEKLPDVRQENKPPADVPLPNEAQEQENP